eukprot:EG_transcript_10133
MPLAECLEYIRTRQWHVQSEPRSQALACRPREPPRLLPLGTECKELGAAPFSVTLCWDEASGEGSVRIARQDACPEEEPFSEDRNTTDLVRRRFGPDSFRVRLEGPEVFVVPFRHEGQCQYAGRFRTTVGGWFTLQATHLFGRYHAVTELIPKPKYTMLRLTDRQYRLGLALPSLRNITAPVLPPCSPATSGVGRWLRCEADWPYLDPFPPWKFPRVPGKNLAEAHSWGSDAHWTPYTCSWQPPTQAEARRCLADSSVLFIGDSMTRSFFYPVLNLLWEDKILGNPKITVADGPKTWTVKPNIRLEYSPDPFLDEERLFRATLRSDAYDVVVLGMGDWPASSTVQPKGLWPLRRYRSHIDSIAADLRSFINRTRTRVVWHTIPAFGIADFDTWRNNRRFELYNAYARQRFEGIGVPVLDLYAISLAMTHAAHDGGHYTTFVADVWAQLLLFHLCSGPHPVKRR